MNSNKILTMNLDEAYAAIESNKISICVIGIGRIGLPTALSFAYSGLKTIGVDVNVDLVNMINSAEFPLKDEPEYDKIFDSVIKNGTFQATSNGSEVIPKSDIVILSLPTPAVSTSEPNYSALRIVGKQLNEFLSANSIVIVESTIEPGFIENELIGIIEGDKSRLEAGKNFSIGVCPETANPGEILSDFKKLPRLVGSIDEKTTSIITKIYQHVFPVELIHMPDCKTANAVKLTTNVFRDINIAFINELSVMFEKLGIDTKKVLLAAKSKYNFQVHYPGAGVGGPCLPANSYQFLNTAKTVGCELKIVQSGREINEKMPFHTIELLSKLFESINSTIENKTILILGVSYKPNVKDIQITPAETIIEKLKIMNVNVKIFDPFYKSTTVFGIKTESDLNSSLENTDGIIIVTAHDEFKNIDLNLLKSKLRMPMVVDTRGIIDPEDAKKVGLTFKGLGRG